jgi:hypothetical protein
MLACLIVTAVVYSPGLSGGYFFDDYPNIVDNTGWRINEISIASLARSAMSSPSSEFRRPLASLSFSINYMLTGDAPFGMKLTNLLIHLCNGALAFLLLRRLLVAGGIERARAPIAAMWCAGVWLILPINLTAVLYIVQRMESLANIFVLLGLIGYMRLRVRAPFRTRDAVYAAGWLVACTGIGLLAKETAVLLPLYALCLEATVLGFGEPGSRARKALTTIYVAILGIPLVIGAVWIVPTLFQPSTWATRDFSLATRLMSEPRIVLDYLVWTIVPTPSALSFYHDDFVQSQGLLTPWTTLLSIVTIVALLVSAWALRRRTPLASLGVFLFFASQTLTGTVLPLELVYEHRNYFASIGVVLAMSEVCRYFITRSTTCRWRLSMALIPLALVGWATALTVETAKAWGQPLSLAEELGRRAPESHRAQYELGRAYIIASGYDRSSPYITMAVPPLETAARMHGASILAEQALIFLYARVGLPVKETWWSSMRDKLHARPATVQDESALGALAQCLRSGGCRFDVDDLHAAFDAAMGQPAPSARLCAMYADFASASLQDPLSALHLSEKAVLRSPDEPVYRINLARRAIAVHEMDIAREQIDALRRLNFAGRLDDDIAALEHESRAIRDEP